MEKLPIKKYIKQRIELNPDLNFSKEIRYEITLAFTEGYLYKSQKIPPDKTLLIRNLQLTKKKLLILVCDVLRIPIEAIEILAKTPEKPKPGRLRAHRRGNQELTDAKAVFCCLAKEHNLGTLTEIGALVGLKHPAVSIAIKGVKNVKERYEKYELVKTKLQNMSNTPVRKK